MVVTQKNENKLLEAKDVRSKTAEVETGKGNSVLDALPVQVACLVATLDTKNTSSGNQRNKEGQQNRGNYLGNQGPGNNNKNVAH